MLFVIAWKNIWRNKTRSLIVMGSVMIGLWVGAFMMSYVFGMIDQRLRDAVENEISHFQVHHPIFDRDNEPEYYLDNGNDILRDLQTNPETRSATARVITYGMVASASTSAGGKFIGILPEAENSVTRLSEKLTQGDYLTNKSRNKVIISERLAKKLKVKIRSKIVLTFQDTTGSIVAGAFRITGLYETYNSAYDDMNIFLRAIDLSTLLNIGDNYHEIAALVHEPEELDQYVSSFSTQYPQSDFEIWKELSPELGVMIDSFDQYMIIFLIIILLALSFGIINTMLMAVLERVREIGMLMAIGMNRQKVFTMISLETIYLVLIATPLGLGLAYITIQYLGEAGMDLSAIYAEGYAAYGFKSYIYPKLDDIYYLRIMIMIVVASLLASIYPALTAIRLNPVEAIRKI